jgi:hypothetical protein
VTRPKPIGHAIRCAKCGQKFTRTHARQRNCPACQPNRVKARSAARAARKSATVPAATPPLGRQLCPDLAAELARKTDDPGPLGTPPQATTPAESQWCQNPQVRGPGRAAGGGVMSGYCADHDPILHATSVTCGTCGTESWPTDAEWVTGTLVLVTYVGDHEYGCPNRRPIRTVLLDLGQDNPVIPPVERPRRCRGTATTTGQQCKHYARPGSGYCVHHDPQRRGDDRGVRP